MDGTNTITAPTAAATDFTDDVIDRVGSELRSLKLARKTLSEWRCGDWAAYLAGVLIKHELAEELRMQYSIKPADRVKWGEKATVKRRFAALLAPN